MDSENNQLPSNKSPVSRNTKQLSKSKTMSIVVSLIILIIIGILGRWGWNYYQDRDNRRLTKELQAEEAEADAAPKVPVSEADRYVGDFKYTAEISLNSDGFNPTTVSVKPQTKLIFSTKSDSRYFIAVSPGSKTPKLFDPKLDITKNTVFQTKVVELGTYSFYNVNNPKSTVVVQVSE